jgi:hypothetical protein
LGPQLGHAGVGKADERANDRQSHDLPASERSGRRRGAMPHRERRREALARRRHHQAGSAPEPQR